MYGGGSSNHCPNLGSRLRLFDGLGTAQNGADRRPGRILRGRRLVMGRGATASSGSAGAAAIDQESHPDPDFGRAVSGP